MPVKKKKKVSPRKKAAKPKKKAVRKKKDKVIAKVDHFFDKIFVAAFKLQAPLKVGDEVWFKGAHADFVQKIESIQIEHKSVLRAKAGQEVGIKVRQKIHEGVVLLPAKLRPAGEPTMIAKRIIPQPPAKPGSLGATKFLKF